MNIKFKTFGLKFSLHELSLQGLRVIYFLFCYRSENKTNRRHLSIFERMLNHAVCFVQGMPIVVNRVIFLCLIELSFVAFV